MGQQQIDEEGYLLYYQIDPESPQLPRITRDVEEATIAIHDFQTITEDEERLQLIQSRLRTDNPDWYLYDAVGASLSDFIGQPNNAYTGTAVEARVRETLLRNQAFSEEELAVQVIPTSPEELLVDVVLDSQSRYLRYAFVLNFDIGISESYRLDENGQLIAPTTEKNPDVYANLPAYENTEEGRGE